MSEYHLIVINSAGLSFLIVNLGVPWALRPNSQVLLRSCPKHVLFFFFRRELPHWTTLGRNLVNLNLTLVKRKPHIWPQKFRNF